MIRGVVLAGLAAFGGACGSTAPSIDFRSPTDGAVVRSPVRLELAASNLDIEPAGPVRPRAGHFHVMVDRDCFREGAFIEMHTPGFKHLGDGASTTTLELTPGRHVLCLQIGNGAHVTLAPTARISITVR